MEKKRYNQMGGREEIEWATIWYDKADTVQHHKVLMIGESAARQIRGTLAHTMGKPVDLFGSSSSLRDVLFWRQMDCFLNDSIYTYDVVIVWMGHHARTDLTSINPMTEQDFKDFRTDFTDLLQRIKTICPTILVLSNFDLIIPPNSKIKRERKIRKLLRLRPRPYQRDEVESAIIERKNGIIKELSLDMGMKFLDMDGIMRQTNFARTDHVHYERKSDQYQVNQIIEALEK